MDSVTILSLNTNQKIANINTDLLDRGVNIETFTSGLDNDTELLKKAIMEAKPHSTLFLPLRTYHIDDEIIVDKPINIVGSGKETIIQQHNWGYPVFRVKTSDGVSIDKISFLSTEETVEVSKPKYSNGEPERDHCSGIYGDECSNLTIGDIWVQGFVNGVTHRGALGCSTDNSIHSLTVKDVSFGLLASGQKRMNVNHIKGSYRMIQNSLPPHLIYFTKGGRSDMSEDITVDNIHAWDGQDSLAVQFKGVKSLQIGKIKAIDCSGVMSIDNVQGAQVGNIYGTGISDVGIYIISTNGLSKSMVFHDVYIEQAPNTDFSTIGWAGSNAENFSFGNVVVRPNMSAASTTPAIYIRGIGHSFNNVIIEHTGVAKHGLTLNQGSNHKISNVQAKNVLSGIIIESGVTNCKINYTPDFIESLYSCVDIKEPSTLVSRTSTYKSQTTRQGSTTIYDIRPTNSSIFEITRSDTTPPNISNPLDKVKSLEFSIMFVNNSSAALSSFTWGSDFTLTGGSLSIGIGKRKLITFMYTGSTWLETHRTGDL